ncbi:MAG: ParA family protein [Chromatiales bacterium]|nr:ParA family protein [Chromatiales bacterium]
MHTIMVLNAKGGCGKTTISTTLACYFSGRNYKTALLDYDPQQSSRRWLELRPADRPKITTIDAARPRTGVTRTFALHTGQETEVAIIDTPAGVTGGQLTDLFHRADTILIPVMPSIIDYQAVELFLKELMRLAKHKLATKRIGIVANRVRIKTRSYLALEELASSFDIPVIATLRDTQNYSIAMESGLGICEMKRSLTSKDDKQWQPLLSWFHEKIPYKPEPQAVTEQPLNTETESVAEAWVAESGLQSVLPFNR